MAKPSPEIFGYFKFLAQSYPLVFFIFYQLPNMEEERGDLNYSTVNKNTSIVRNLYKIFCVIPRGIMRKISCTLMYFTNTSPRALCRKLW